MYKPTFDAKIARAEAEVVEAEASLARVDTQTTLQQAIIAANRAEVKAAAVSTGYAATEGTTADGDKLSIYLNTDMGVMINGTSSVITADIDASNGVINEIDAVILPLSIAGLIAVNSEFSSLETALSVADGNLDSVLNDPASAK